MKEFKNVQVEVFTDEYAESPRTFCDRLTTIYSNHRHYDPDGHDLSEFDNGAGDVDWKRLDKEYIYLKIRAYIHGGITISTSYGYPYTDQFDSGLFGIIAISKERAREEFGILRATTVKKIQDLMRDEVAELDSWYQGDVYGFKITKGDIVVESCGNFYGCKDLCEKEAESVAEYWDRHYDTQIAV